MNIDQALAVPKGGISHGGMLSVITRPIEKGLRARAQAEAFSAQIDVMCARSDQLMVLGQGKLLHHIEIADTLEALCDQADAIMNQMQVMDNQSDCYRSLKEKLTRIIPVIEKFRSALIETRARITSEAGSLPYRFNQNSILLQEKRN